MPWIKISDDFMQHPKVLALSGPAVALWLEAACFAGRHLTDGIVAPQVLRALRFRKAAPELRAAGLWHPGPDGDVIHDWADYQPTRAEVEEQRAISKARLQRWRQAKREAKAQADGNALCNAVSNAGVTPFETLPPSHPVPTRPIPTHPIPKSVTDARAREAPAPVNGTAVPDDIWQAWRTVASAHGTDIRLAASHTETLHLMELAAAYTVDDLTTAMHAWWASPYVPSRSVGLFKAQIADVLAHLSKPGGTRAIFGAPHAERVKAVKAVPPGGGWTCPHTPRCERRWACERKTQTAALVGAREEA